MMTLKEIKGIDESGMRKSGRDTAGVVRQYNANRGKVENCIVSVHLDGKAECHQTRRTSRTWPTEEDTTC